MDALLFAIVSAIPNGSALKRTPTVELRRLLVVFHGGRVVCLEEV